jgi:hypothetical protein
MNIDKKRASKNRTHFFSEPGDIFLVQTITCSWPADGTFNPTGMAQYLEVLGHCGLGNGQVIDYIAGYAAGMGNQEFHDLKSNGIANRLKHGNEAILVGAGDI